MNTRACPACGEQTRIGSVCMNDGSKIFVEDTLKAGDSIGRYVLEEKIGSGGMGQVWKGKNPAINKQAAIKILNAEMLSNETAVARFKKEALAVNEIRHKNLVDIFDIGELPDGRPYFVMEYLEGESLDDLLRRRSPLPISEILPILSSICRAVTACHQKNIIHRDLKPENIFLVREEDSAPTIKILDFGIAKFTPTASSNMEDQATRAGTVIGTPAYMSPEQCEGTKTVDFHSDIYALGIILYEMITGRTPFDEPGESTGMVLIKHITAKPPLLHNAVAGRELPEGLDDVLQRALAKDPNERYQSATALFQDFSKITAPKKSESATELKQAKPLFAPAANEAPAAKNTVIPIEEAPSRTGDFYVGAPSTPPPRGNNKKLIWVGAVFSILLGVSASFLVPSSPQTTIEQSPASAPVPTPVSIPASTPVTAPVSHKPVRLWLASKPSGASVFLGDNPLGQTPLDVQLPYQTENINLRISLDGYETIELPITPNTDLDPGLQNLKKIKTTPDPVIKTPIDKTKVTPPPKEDPDIFIYDPKKPKK
jgi:serine/threonine protein kinase